MKNPKFVLRKDTGTLQLTYSNKGKWFRVNSHVKCNPENWNEEKQIKLPEKTYYKENMVLSGMLKRLKDIIYEFKLKTGNSPATDYVYREYQKPLFDIINDKNVYDSYVIWMEDKKTKIKDIRHYNTLKNNLQEHFRNLLFSEVNDDFKNKLIRSYIKKGLNNYTIIKRLKCLKAFLNDMYIRKILKNDDFKNWKFIELITPEKPVVCLSKVELNKVKKYKCKNERDQYYLDLFLIGCGTGLRYSDLIRLQKENIKTIDKKKFICININKTGEEIRIPLNNLSNRILKKYDYNIIKKSNQKINENLKKIFKETKYFNEIITMTSRSGNKINIIKDNKYNLLTFHASRRTFITICISNGVTSDSIMKWSGHKDLDVFYKYVKKGLTEMKQMKDLFK